MVALEIDSALTRGIFPSKKSFGLVPNGSFGLVLLCLFRFCKLKISKCSSSLFTVTSFFLNLSSVLQLHSRKGSNSGISRDPDSGPGRDSTSFLEFGSEYIWVHFILYSYVSELLTKYHICPLYNSPLVMVCKTILWFWFQCRAVEAPSILNRTKFRW